ncbi:universal stress protein [Streptomyces kunmingensis]|uniref:Universal stress protein n=1 Tax=Streptomyces kunmingensis TaxID=68225 RepID=A0ABU6CE81_9ACTN|nr:universal stress protein [Streptomyces kunmingensis]MEB3962685.1 universal stress protein [Streptomyces kunmingensis]
MAHPITVGLDGTAESMAAADWAAREALLRSLPLDLLHAWKWQPYLYAPLGDVCIPPNVDATEPNWAGKMLGDAETVLAQRYPGLRISSRDMSEEPVAALLAASDQARLLVLGSRGLGGLTGFVVGSVAHAVVARTVRPVVLVRAEQRAEDEHDRDKEGEGTTATPYRDVVVGLDLERPDDAVLEFAFDAAGRRAGRLRVVHGLRLPPYYTRHAGSLGPELHAQLVAGARKVLNTVLRPWRRKYPGVDVTEQAFTGGAGLHLVRAARDASLVVVGRRHRHSALGGHVGPVTQAVLHHATVPVAVVPHD